jgi:uncharacterized pyridoxamine 5'-phosphate oxidase family protein
MSLGFMDEKLLIGVAQMETTLKNIKTNNQICLVGWNENEFYRIEGKAKIFSSGRHLNTAIKRSKHPYPKKVVIVEIKRVFDLDKAERIFEFKVNLKRLYS